MRRSAAAALWILGTPMGVMDDLAVKIGGATVSLSMRRAADAGGGAIEQNRRTESACADGQRARPEFLLAPAPDTGSTI